MTKELRNEGGGEMEESKRIALLEEEISNLKKENELLFKIVAQMKESVNLLVGRYIVNGRNQE